MSTASRAFDPDARRWTIAGLVALAVCAPMLLLGPGNDLDVGGIFRAGRSLVLHLSYSPSRPPGAPVHEGAVGVLDAAGGPLLSNVGSLAMGAVTVVALYRLLRREGVSERNRLVVVLVAVNPWFVIAATSTIDYLWGLGLVMLAVLALRNDRPALAGVLGALAIGCRVGSVLLLLGALLAELPDGREPRRRAAITAAVMVPVALLIFVPPFLALGTEFARNDFRNPGLWNLVGRAGVKTVLLLGPVASAVALLALPPVIRAVARWRSSWLVRFAVVGLVLSELSFIRFPWKQGHLLPVLLCGAILLAVALERRHTPLLVALIALQLIYGVVRIDAIAPNEAGDATSARVRITTGWGPVVNDLLCRDEHRDAYLGKQIPTVQDAWICTAPFGSRSGGYALVAPR